MIPTRERVISGSESRVNFFVDKGLTFIYITTNPKSTG
jgi:hypothetical protein